MHYRDLLEAGEPRVLFFVIFCSLPAVFVLCNEDVTLIIIIIANIDSEGNFSALLESFLNMLW